MHYIKVFARPLPEGLDMSKSNQTELVQAIDSQYQPFEIST